MSLDIVGKENLPNAYIKEVSIEALDEYNIIVSPVIYLKDLKTNARFQWYDNEQLRKSMKIFIVTSSSGTFNAAITEGSYDGGFSPKHINKIPGYDSDLVKYKIISLQNIDKADLAESAESVSGGMLYTFGYRCRFVSRNSGNVSVFVACMLDTSQFASEEGLDLAHPLIDTFYGAIAGESIIKGNKVQATSNLFFNGDVLWTGPVHKQSGKYMAGSKPSGLPQVELTRRTILNTKIKDYRINFQKKPKLAKGKVREATIFSRLYPSFNANGNMTGTFEINMKQLFIQKTRYGALLLQLNKEMFDSMMSKIKIKRFEIYQEQVLLSTITSEIGTSKLSVRKSFNKKLLISSHDSSPYSLRTKYRYYSSNKTRDRMLYSKIRGRQTKTETMKALVKEVANKNTLETRAFVFSDLFNSYQTAGHFRYSVDLEINDPTYEYVREMLGEIKNAYSRFKTYKRQIEKTIYYDYNLDRTKELYIQTNKSEQWLTFIDVYLKYYNLLFKCDNNEVRDLGKQLVSLINPRSATVKSLDRFSQNFSFLLSYFMDFFEQTNKLFNDPNSRGNVKVNSNRGKIQASNVFTEILSFNQNQRRLAFLPEKFSNKDLEDFPVVTKGDFRRTASEEKQKYFKSNPQFTEASVPILGYSDYVWSFNQVNAYSSAFLSPKKLFIKDNSYRVTNLELIDVADFNKFYSKFSSFETKAYDHYADASNSEVAKANRYFSSFYIRKPTAMQKNEKEEPEHDVGTVVGDDSNFAPTQQENFTLQNSTLAPRISTMFKSYESSHASKSSLDGSYYVLDNSKNILTSLLGSPSFNSFSLRRIPLQVKSLLGSPYNFSRSNILKANADLLVHSRTRDLAKILFFTLVKVEYLQKYEKTSAGETDLNRPVWKPLTTMAINSVKTSTLCRMSFYSNERLKIPTPTLNSYNIENAYFYLGRGSVKDELTQTDPLSVKRQGFLSATYGSITEANQYPVEYTKSSIITQTDDKNGPLRRVNYAEQIQVPSVSNAPAANTRRRPNSRDRARQSNRGVRANRGGRNEY